MGCDENERAKQTSVLVLIGVNLRGSALSEG